MASERITFFDLPSKEPCVAWSLNPWKTRLLLNYKGLDYETKWTEYPDIEPTLKSHVEPGTGNWPYTIPAIKFPDGTWAQDSRKIADLIEERYPERPVHLDSPYQARIEAAVPKTVMPLMAIAINQVPRRLLNQRSMDYWLVDRAKMVGCDVAQFEAEKGGEPAYVAAEAGLKDVTDMLKENPDGPFFGGKDLCYADFVWVGALYFFKRIGEDFYENIMKHTSDRKVHDDLLKAAEPWLKRGDH